MSYSLSIIETIECKVWPKGITGSRGRSVTIPYSPSTLANEELNYLVPFKHLFILKLKAGTGPNEGYTNQSASMVFETNLASNETVCGEYGCGFVCEPD